MENQIVSARHEAFLDNLLTGAQSIEKAARNAGFTNPHRDAIAVMSTPATRKYVRKRLRGGLECEAGPACYQFLLRIVRDEKAPLKIRAENARFLLSMALPAPKAVDAPDDTEKEPDNMTSEELRAFIAAGERELSERSVVTIEGVILHQPEHKEPQALEDLY